MRVRIERLRKEKYQHAFQDVLVRYLEITDSTNVEEDWRDLKKTLIEASEKLVGKSKRGERGQSWWGDELHKLVQSKKKAYKKWLCSRSLVDKKDFRDICSKVKSAVKVAKEKEWDRFGKELQDSFYNNSKVFWKKVKGARSSQRIMLKNKGGELIEEDQTVADCCAEYFKRLYNDGFKEDSEHNLAGKVRLDDTRQQVNVVEPTLEEVRRAVNKLKWGKAAGGSGVAAEMVKAGGDVVVERLHSLFKKVWLSEVIPEDWQCGVVIPLHKKGDRMNLDNYRGITLMDVVGKVFSGIIRDRLEDVYRNRIAEEQAGFRKGRGCVDQIYSLAQIISKRLAVQKNTYLCFGDLKKAYNSVWRVGLIRRLNEDMVPVKLASLVRCWYAKVRARVKVNDTNSKWFVFDTTSWIVLQSFRI